MTISTTTSTVAYTGNGVTTAFSVPFPFFGATELTVIERVTATGVETTKALSTHYTVSGGDGSTGTVTALVAPASTVTWTIIRTTARTQLTDYVDYDAFPAAAHERALDRAMAVAQEIDQALTRTLRVPDTDPVPAQMPSAVERASLFLAFDASGNPIAAAATSGAVPVTTYATTLLDDSTAAEARATLGLDQAMRLIERQTLSSPAAAVDFAVPSGYVRYVIVFSRVVLATNNASLYLRASVDGGATFLAGTEYAWGAVYNDAASAGYAAANSAAQAVISGAASNATDLSIAGRYELDVGSATLRATLTGHAIAFDNPAGVMLAWNAGASIAAGADVDAIRFLASTGNITWGVFELWGAP